jgi:hypothetical protein
MISFSARGWSTCRGSRGGCGRWRRSRSSRESRSCAPTRIRPCWRRKGRGDAGRKRWEGAMQGRGFNANQCHASVSREIHTTYLIYLLGNTHVV